MILAFVALALGLGLLVWSADRFVDGSAAVARYYRMPSLLIGMVIIGFGTSAPEMVVSAIASLQGNAGIALGNAYGSNITNIALILGVTSLIRPISVHSQVLKKELPILFAITLLTLGLLYDFELSRFDAMVLLLVFAGLMVWTIIEGMKHSRDQLAVDVDQELEHRNIDLKRSLLELFGGLVLLIVASRIFVWGAVKIAVLLGVSDIIIGLTIVAVGTSLPELASSVIAARKGESDLALGNILGSNLFNTLAVVGIAGSISPMSFEREIFTRDLMVMTFFTLSLFVIGYGYKRQGRINRYEGAALLIGYILYTLSLM